MRVHDAGPADSAARSARSTGADGRPGRGGRERTVHSISAMPAPASLDRDTRLQRYLLSMGIRTACFALAGVVHLTLGWSVLAWILMIAAVLLPYPAVVFANNVNRRTEVREFTSPTRQLHSSAAEADPDAADTASPSADGPAR